MDKHYISPQQLLRDSYELAWQVYDSGYRPNFIVGVWRGGTPVGIALQELLQLLGVESDHLAIRTSSYTGIAERSREVRVQGLDYLVSRLGSGDSLLIVDDVHDTGLSIDQVVRDLAQACAPATPQVRIATPYYKPANNRTGRVPNYYLHENNDWLVFPHELEGLDIEEIRAHKPELDKLLKRLEPLISGR